ncbi:hypothetical protein ABZ464_32725 [Streptomyces sp. NPDC005820]|uniref:hypothetical protein n=1 Tax=Streptomyces sp. NPDC005820 TaxID=3157069 RepID=UPI0033F6103D
MSALDELIRLCPAPSTRHGRPGTSAGAGPGGPAELLPPGYTALLEVYGPGCFNDFFWIYEDGCPNPWLDIRARSRKTSEILAGKQIPEIRSTLTEFDSDPSRLIQWGVTDNADSVFWIPVGAPDEWPTIIVEAGQLSFQLLQQPSPDIVLGLLDGTLRCPFFPPEFRSNGPVFERWVEEADGSP